MSEQQGYTDPAMLAYDAYAQYTGGKTYDGREMPKWLELPARIRNAWRAAAAAARVEGQPAFEAETESASAPSPAGESDAVQCKSTLGDLRCQKGQGHDGKHAATPTTGGKQITWPKLPAGPVGS